MPRTGERGGPQTRARIAEVAARLFLDRGFDAVTVADVAREAGVSSVTVFNHFPRKEDLFLDRQLDAAQLLGGAVRDRPAGVDVLTALHDMTLRLHDTRSPLSGLDERSVPFFRTVAASPALIARARQIGADLQRSLAEDLERDPTAQGDAALLAAFFVAGYGTVLTETARRLIDGDERGLLIDDHRMRLEQLVDGLRSGVAGPGETH